MTTCTELKEKACFEGMDDASLEVAWQLMMTRSLSTITINIISGASMDDFSMILMERYKHSIANALLDHLPQDAAFHISGVSYDEYNQQYKGKLIRKTYLRDVAIRLMNEGFTESSACDIICLDPALLSEKNWTIYKENYNTGYQNALYKAAWRMHKYECSTAAITSLTKLDNETVLKIIEGIKIIQRIAKNPEYKNRISEFAEMLDIPFNVATQFIDD